MSEPVGLIGLGLLGSAIADRLADAGHDLYGFDPKPPETSPVTLCKEAGEVVERCPTVLFSLPTSGVVSKVIDGVEGKLRPGQIILDTTTGSPEEAAAMAERLSAIHVHYLEINVAGSSEQLRNGWAVLFVGGDSQVLEKIEPQLVVLARKYHYLGSVGTASRFKLVHNLILGLNRLALAEGLQFAEALGFDPTVALSMLRGTAAGSVAMEAKGERMACRNYVPPQARLSQHLKDVLLMLNEAEIHGANVPVTELHRKLLERAVDLGFGDADNCAIQEAFHR